MKIPSTVIEHHFDKDLLDQIDTLRVLQLSTAEAMLNDLDKTSFELCERGLTSVHDASRTDDIRSELTERVALLRARLGNRDVVYSDEIGFMVDLLESDQALGESLDLV